MAENNKMIIQKKKLISSIDLMLDRCIGLKVRNEYNRFSLCLLTRYAITTIKKCVSKKRKGKGGETYWQPQLGHHLFLIQVNKIINFKDPN